MAMTRIMGSKKYRKKKEEISAQQELRTLFSICQHSLDFPPYTAYL